MAVDKHPSRRPSPPRKPPATSTTAGTINKIPCDKGSGQAGVEYGFRHELKVHGGGSEMAHHFKDGGSSEGKAPRAGKEQPQEGPKKGQRVGRPGDEKGNDEPG